MSWRQKRLFFVSALKSWTISNSGLPYNIDRDLFGKAAIRDRGGHIGNVAHRPIRNLKERKNLARDLHQKPRHHTVGDRNFVNVASLQFVKEIPSSSLGFVFAKLLKTRIVADLIPHRIEPQQRGRNRIGIGYLQQPLENRNRVIG